MDKYTKIKQLFEQNRDEESILEKYQLLKLLKYFRVNEKVRQWDPIA